MTPDRSPKQEAKSALTDLEAFALEQRMARAEGDAPVHEREPYFFLLARRAVADPTLARLDELLEEFRGTGHYVAGYARDQEGVSQHLERLYAAVEVLRKEFTNSSSAKTADAALKEQSARTGQDSLD